MLPWLFVAIVFSAEPIELLYRQRYRLDGPRVLTPLPQQFDQVVGADGCILQQAHEAQLVFVEHLRFPRLFDRADALYVGLFHGRKPHRRKHLLFLALVSRQVHWSFRRSHGEPGQLSRLLLRGGRLRLRRRRRPVFDVTWRRWRRQRLAGTFRPSPRTAFDIASGLPELQVGRSLPHFGPVWKRGPGGGLLAKSVCRGHVVPETIADDVRIRGLGHRCVHRKLCRIVASHKGRPGMIAAASKASELIGQAAVLVPQSVELGNLLQVDLLEIAEQGLEVVCTHSVGRATTARPRQETDD
mmetsp:Transcript_120113/g.339906  ORF Transcript_120113/g.339906 Transcript_120113/m.339906 type:complete len:299 (-) Transcript_120113:19-915(-)